ncbi:DUF899 domain-containing protein [Pseudonocardia spinosispora]|uniref:DUF899 domain-containing protein n=1 Tax=Pseudonocardia spinosispora TaxID=103441 RepID=UPI00048A6807|nr:DUF899 domain-containing protein [Pseudonocardia spinosispora]
MSLPQVVSREQWLVARKALLAKEKELTRTRDALNTRRRELPMVEVEKEYLFEGSDGKATLLDLFDGHRQLIVSHVMFDPSWDDACPSCTAGIEERSPGLVEHLSTRDTALVHVSRAPIAKIEDYRRRKGWDITWVSSHGSDFNYDYAVTMDDSVTPVIYNYKTVDEHRDSGTEYYFSGQQPSEQPGMSCFLRNGDAIFHTYSTYGRGAEQTGGSYYYLDLTALGRQEKWEEPSGRADFSREPVPDFHE